MKYNVKRLTGAIAWMAALAVIAPLVPLGGSAQALPTGTPAAGAINLTPSSGDSSTPFAIAFATPPQSCPGDNTAGYTWGTFLTPLANDPAPITYTASGSPIGVPAASTVSLRNPAGTQLRGIAPGLGDGLVVAPGSVSFQSVAFATLPAGAYNVGIACVLPDGAAIPQTARFWSTTLTITSSAGAGPNNFTWSVGTVPAAPAITTVTPGNGTLAVAFTHAASTPPTTGYTVSALPPSGPVVTATGGASPITVSGLTNGTVYSVTVTATNTVGTGAPSAAVNGTPSLAAQPPVTNLAASPGAAGSAVLSWTAPAGSATPTGYTVGVSPTVPGAPFTTLASPFTVSSLAAGTTYTFTVTATYAAPDTGTPASVTFIAVGAQVIIQDITAVRPAGALILTQRCGVFGALNAVSLNGIPGFEAGFSAAAASVDTVGTAPTTGASPGGPADPQFPNYPFPSPASYPTHCNVNLGTGSFVTTGTLAGQYYSAGGRLNQVTVSDNRDASFGGWTVNATMSNFVNGSSTFSGNNLGWIPQVASSTPGQTVTVGAGVNPLTTPGLAGGKTLASAPAGAATGIAKLDARLLLLIPVSAATGTYTGTLTLSAI